MDEAQELHLIGQPQLHKRGKTLEELATEEVDRDRLNLAKAGKKQVLKAGYAFALGFLLGFENGGPAGLVYGFFLTWLGTMAVFGVMAELSSMIPTAGGQYHWVSVLAPAHSRKFLSYVTGWLTIAGWIAALSAASYFVSGLIQALISQNNPDYNTEGWHGALIYWAVLLLCVSINTVLSGLLPAIEVFIFILHVLGFFAILIPLVTLAPHGSARTVFTTFLNKGEWGTQTLAFFIGLNGNAASFIGTDGAVHMSEEVKNASTNVARSMVYSVFINGVLAFGMLMGILFCYGSISAAANSPYPFVPIFAQAVGTNYGATAMASIVVVLQFCAATGALASASRLMWSFARDHGLPGWKFLRRVDARTTIPVISVGVVTTISVFLGLINIGNAAAFNDVISLTLESLFTSYLIACVLLLYHRIKGNIGLADTDTDAESSERFTWGAWRIPGVWGIINNTGACIYLIIICFFSFWPASKSVTAANMNYSSLATGAVTIGSVAYYAIWARKTYRGPIVETNSRQL